MLRCRNEEQYLQQSLESLKQIKAPHEIIIILHLCTDGSEKIAIEMSKTMPIKIYKYNIEISRAGYQTLITPANNPHSLSTYYNWCYKKCTMNWLFKWDADMKCSNKLANFLNSININEQNLIQYRISCYDKTTNHCNYEPYLSNAITKYTKHIFWEIPSFTNSTKCIELDKEIQIINMNPPKVIKKYWKKNKWFKNDKHFMKKYNLLTNLYGIESCAMARSFTTNSDNIYLQIKNDEKMLNKNGIYLYSSIVKAIIKTNFYYLYSPLYNYYNKHIIKNLSNIFNIHGIIMDDLDNKSQHPFFGGVSIKIETIVDCIKKNMNRYIIFSDATIFINSSKISQLYNYINTCKNCDLCFASHVDSSNHNIGLILINCNNKTLNFFISVLQELKKNNGWDQQVVNDLLKNNNNLSVSNFCIDKIYCNYNIDEKYKKTYLIYKSFIWHTKNKNKNFNKRLDIFLHENLITQEEYQNNYKA